MGAWMIFCCHDCKAATYHVKDGQYHNMNDGETKSAAMLEWIALHPYHKISFQSDAHGQLSPEDFIERMNEDGDTT